MSRLNGRITRLEEQTGADEKTAVIVAGDVIYDVQKGEPYTGDPVGAVVIAHVTADLWAAI